MDAFWSAAVSAIPQASVGGLVLVLLIIVMRWTSQDRTDYRKALADEVKRINADHDSERAEWKADIAELRKRVDELQLDLDRERKARREAEDMLAEARRRLT